VILISNTLVDNGCNIWNGDAYKNYVKYWEPNIEYIDDRGILTQEDFINEIKTDDVFARERGVNWVLFMVQQWRKWS
jgi:hypothetical protein